jgi:hypothetical protein
MFLKTLEMLSIHWQILSPNTFRYRIKKMNGLNPEMDAIPKQVKESFFYHIKTIALGTNPLDLYISRDQKHEVSKYFLTAQCRLELCILDILSTFRKLEITQKKLKKQNKGLFKQIWNSFVDTYDPITDPALQTSIRDKLLNFDKHIRTLEQEYIHELKLVGPPL